MRRETGFGLWADWFGEVGDGNSEFDSGVGLMDWEIGFGLVFSGGVELGVGGFMVCSSSFGCGC